MKIEQNRKNQGFTLIELILVIGVITAIGAMAAPQFTDVFDHSKDQADVAQMDSLMAAFRLEQSAFYESHDGDYDLLNGSVPDVDGNMVVTPDAAQKILQNFLDAIASPSSLMYREDVKCLKTEKTHHADDETVSVFTAMKDGEYLWIECSEDSNKSAIKVRIPSTEKPIREPYTDGEVSKGTWMVIGDDDRLRADYIKDLLYHVREEDGKEVNDKEYKGFKNKVNQDHEYRYRTTFKIEANLKEEEPIAIDKAWITFDSQYAGNHNFFIFNSVTENDVDVYLTVFEYKDGSLKTRTEMGRLAKGVEMYKSPPGHSGTPGNDKHEVRYVFTFKKDGKYIGKIAHKIHFIHKNKVSSEMVTFIANDENGVDEGYYDTGANSFRYFHHLYDPAMSDLEPGTSGLPGSGSESDFIFHTGAVFNINNANNGKYNNYDFLSFEENDDGEMALRSYCVQGGSVSKFESEAGLNGFEFGKTYTMELTVNKGKTSVDLSDNLLDESEKLFITSQDLHPAMGYYMNQEVVLSNDQGAVADENDHLPFVVYKSGGNEGPQLVLLSMPEVYPYQTENAGGDGTDDPDDPEEPEELVFKKPIFGNFNGNPKKPYSVSANTSGNSIQYNWEEGIENSKLPVDDWTDTDEIPEGKSGWLWAREYKGKEMAPQEKWAKKPWIGSDVHCDKRVVIEQILPYYKMKYVYPNFIEVGFDDFVVKMKKDSGDWKSLTSVSFNPNLEAGFEVKIKYQGKQVSESISRLYEPIASIDKQSPRITVEVDAKYSQAGNSHKYKFDGSYVMISSDEPVSLSGDLVEYLESESVFNQSFDKNVNFLSFMAIDDAGNATSVRISLETDANTDFQE